MNVTKRLLAISLGTLDPKRARLTFTVESEGGDVETFAASDEVFSAVLQFMRDIDNRVRQDRDVERITDPLQPAEEIDVFLDLRTSRALLRVHAARGRAIQLELSEELLTRLAGKLPAILAELRKHKRDQSH